MKQDLHIKGPNMFKLYFMRNYVFEVVLLIVNCYKNCVVYTVMSHLGVLSVIW